MSFENEFKLDLEQMPSAKLHIVTARRFEGVRQRVDEAIVKAIAKQGRDHVAPDIDAFREKVDKHGEWYRQMPISQPVRPVALDSGIDAIAFGEGLVYQNGGAYITITRLFSDSSPFTFDGDPVPGVDGDDPYYAFYSPIEGPSAFVSYSLIDETPGGDVVDSIVRLRRENPSAVHTLSDDAARNMADFIETCPLKADLYRTYTELSPGLGDTRGDIGNIAIGLNRDELHGR